VQSIVNVIAQIKAGKELPHAKPLRRYVIYLFLCVWALENQKMVIRRIQINKL
jgi:hypothetical protein